MRYFLPTIVLTLAVTILSGCTTMSEKDYKLAKAVMAESPTVRAEVMNECVANLNREPKSEQKFMSDYLKIPQSKYAKTVCGRMVRAFAKGQITYADINSANSGEKMLRIMDGK